MTSTTQPKWSSRLSFIIASTGAAVGLGNIWKVPYEFGLHGGGAYVLVYSLALIALGIPMVLAEFTLGFLGKKSPPMSLKAIGDRYNKNKSWVFFGYLGLVTLILVLSFYAVVSGWIIDYLIYSINQPVESFNNEHWTILQSSPLRLVTGQIIFLVMTCWVINKGINRGIETASNIMLPMLFIFLISLSLYNSFHPGFKETLDFLFSWKSSSITLESITSALGHAFFTLALGAGCLLMYAAYLPSTHKIIQSVMLITFFDLSISILSGLAIFPFVFSSNMDLDQGPKLLFITLPQIFSKLPFSKIWSLSFFTMLLFAAWTSSISLAEPLVRFLEEKNIKRSIGTYATGFLAFMIGLPSLMSLGPHQFFGYNAFNFITTLTTHFLLPVGALGLSLFTARTIPLNDASKAIGLSLKITKCWLIWLQYLVPILMAALLLLGV